MTCCGCGDNDEHDRDNEHSSNSQEDFDLLPQEYDPKYGSTLKAFKLQSRYLLSISGEPILYDRKFKGPLSKRSCTDIPCLIIFLAFLGAWGYIAAYGE